MAPSAPQLALGDLTAVVLAGGLGTRVQHLLPGLPKPMAPVAGRPFLEWVIRYLAKQGVRRVIISSGYRAEVIARHFEPQPVRGVQVTCVAEPEPLGTAGGFLHAVKTSGKSAPAWLVLNGDSLVLAPLHEAVQRLHEPNCSGVIVGRKVPDTSRFGSIMADEQGKVLSFAEKQPGSGVINAGIYLLREELVRTLPERRPLSFEKEVFPELARLKTGLQLSVHECAFLDIGTPDTLPQAEIFIRSHPEQFLVES